MHKIYNTSDNMDTQKKLIHNTHHTYILTNLVSAKYMETIIKDIFRLQNHGPFNVANVDSLRVMVLVKAMLI